MNMINRYSGIAAAVLASMWAGQASADTIKSFHPKTEVVTSKSSMKTMAIQISGSGTVEIKLSDLLWPEAFEQLSFMVSTSREKLYSRTVESSDDSKDKSSDKSKGNSKDDKWSGSLSFNVSGPTTLYVTVYARNHGNKAGAYHFDCNVTPVPVPAAGWLLLSGMAGLVATRRKVGAAIRA